MFPVGDVTAGAVALRTALADGRLRERLRTSAERPPRTYTAANMVDGYRHIYEEMLAGRRHLDVSAPDAASSFVSLVLPCWTVASR